MNRINLIRAAVPIILLVVTLGLSQRPYYNWDMFPYMALALSDPSTPFDSTHQQVYKIAKAELLPKDFEAISSRQPMLMKDASAFKDILKYFELKPGYNLIVSGFYRLGVNPFISTYLPSLISYFLLGCLLFWWFQLGSPALLSALVTLIVMSSPLLIDLARYSSPDMLCALASIVGFVFILQGKWRLGMSALLIAILIRPDSSILFGCVLVAGLFSGMIRLQFALIAGVAAVGFTYFLFGSLELILEYLPETASAGNPWLEGLPSVWHSYTLPFLILSVVGIWMNRLHGKVNFGDPKTLLLLAATTSIILRYLLHPFVEDRFHLPGYLIILMVFWMILMENAGQRKVTANG